jgi:dienelactone hydrolase
MRREDVSFRSGSDDCAAWLYRPTTAGPGTRPCVVMANGFSMTRHDGLEAYADALAAAGAVVLAFDHRFLGDSGGEPRQRFRAGEQAEDLASAVAFARGLEGVDPEQIIVWGFSFAGGTAVDLAAADPRIAGVMLLNPFLDGAARVLGTLRRTPWVAIRLMAAAVGDLAGRRALVPVTGPVGSYAGMAWEGEGAGFAAAAAPGSPWRNEMLPGLFATIAFHRPVRRARRLTVPVWISRGTRDITVSARAIERLAARAPRAELHHYDVDHFETSFGPGQQLIAADQAAWLVRTFRVPTPT